MSFPATEEHPNTWEALLGQLANLKGEWLFRGAMANWNAEPSLERVVHTHWEIPLSGASKIESKLLREFKRHPEVKGLAGDPDDDLEWFALMQHYGAPTRLLDWSYSPFAALFFALDVLLNSRPDSDPSKDPKAALWALRSAWFDEALPMLLATPELQKLEAYKERRDGPSFRALFVEPNPRPAFVYPVNPIHLNARLSAQQGVFLCPADISQTFMANLGTLGALANPTNARSFILSRGILREGFDCLNRMNVSARNLYPDLAGYAQWLKHRVPFLPELPQ